MYLITFYYELKIQTYIHIHGVLRIHLEECEVYLKLIVYEYD